VLPSYSKANVGYWLTEEGPVTHYLYVNNDTNIDVRLVIPGHFSLLNVIRRCPLKRGKYIFRLKLLGNTFHLNQIKSEQCY